MGNNVPNCPAVVQSGPQSPERTGRISYEMTADYALLYQRARAISGLTQDELGEQLGLDRKAIARVEQGIRTPKRGERIAVAVVTGLPLSFFGDNAAASQLEALARIQQELAQRPHDTAGAPTPPKPDPDGAQGAP
jgi:transcriptional regulator with XRE-family HTH domain